MSKTPGSRRPKAETPKGFRDYFGHEVTARKAMLDKIAAVYHRYGFDALETSAVETVEVLGKFLPDVDRPNEGVFAWQEDDKDWLALRYDLTAPLARVAAQYRQDLPTPYRRYAMGPVWRNEKPGPGRFRQFYQCDADTVGAASVAADAEICAMLADALEEVGIPRGDYVIRVNNRKVLNGVMEVAGIWDPADPSKFEHERGIVLRAIDKLDRLGVEGVRALLGEGRKDESGDFTKGAGLEPEQIETVMSFLSAKESAAKRSLKDLLDAIDRKETIWAEWIAAEVKYFDSPTTMSEEKFNAGYFANGLVLDELRKVVEASQIGNEGVDELEQIAALMGSLGYGPNRVVIDPTVVRGLGYYTGPVFEAELTFEILDEKGRPRQFGSVAGGGRYDDLVKRFTGQAVPATGVSIGVDRLLAALAAKGRATDSDIWNGPVVVTVMDRDRMSDYMSIVKLLRDADLDPNDPSKGKIRAEVFLGNPKDFSKQMKYANRRHSPIAIIQGADEAARDMVQVKDLIAGAKLASEASLEEWKSNPTQDEVTLSNLVAKVREILARHR
jgi:histidyl-tRNA synthetase